MCQRNWFQAHAELHELKPSNPELWNREAAETIYYGYIGIGNMELFKSAAARRLAHAFNADGRVYLNRWYPPFVLPLYLSTVANYLCTVRGSVPASVLNLALFCVFPRLLASFQLLASQTVPTSCVSDCAKFLRLRLCQLLASQTVPTSCVSDCANFLRLSAKFAANNLQQKIIMHPTCFQSHNTYFILHDALPCHRSDQTYYVLLMALFSPNGTTGLLPLDWRAGSDRFCHKMSACSASVFLLFVIHFGLV
jgi:hypothetical protein